MKLNLRITKKYSMYVPTRGLCITYTQVMWIRIDLCIFLINGAMN